MPYDGPQTPNKAAEQMIFRPPALIAISALALAACDPSVPDSGLRPSLVDAQGHCYGRTTTPAKIETVTVQVVERPAQVDGDGTVIRPAVYRTETRQRIVTERQVIEYETPCAEAFTSDFISSLQRALAARGLYSGDVNGRLDAATGAAIRAFQKPLGIDSPVLSMQAARALGLVTLSREQLDALSR